MSFTKKTIEVIQVFDGEVVAASNSAISVAVPIRYYSPEGFFSLQVEVTGSGTLDITVEGSNNNVDFLTPSGVSNVATGFTATSGPGSNGKDIFLVDPNMVLDAIKIKATETGGVNPATISAWLCIQ